MRRRDFLTYGGATGLHAALGSRLAWSQGAPRALTMWQGVNSVTGVAHSAAVMGETTSSGGTSDLRITVCESISQFKKTIEIGSSVSVGVGNIGGGSAKTTWAHSLQMDERTLSIVARVRRSVGLTTFEKVRLNEEADGYINRRLVAKYGMPSPQGFCRLFGDSWVASLERGGEYMAVYMFNTSSVQERTTLSQELSAYASYGRITASADFSRKMTEYSRKERRFSDLQQLITGFTNPPPYPAPDKIAEFALNFSTLQLTSPAALAYTTRGYEEVPQLDDAFPEAVSARTYFIGSSSSGVLEEASTGLMRDRQALLTKRTALNKIVRAQRRYGLPPDAALTQNGQAFEADHRAINAQIEAFSSNPNQRFTRPNLRSEAIGTPYLLIRTPDPTKRFGGDYGGALNFDDLGDGRAAILDGRRVHSISLCAWRTFNPQSEIFVGLKTTFVYPDNNRQTVVAHGPTSVPTGQLVWTNELFVYDFPLTEIVCQHTPGRSTSAVRLRAGDTSIETPFLNESQIRSLTMMRIELKTERWEPARGDIFMGFGGSEMQNNTLGVRGLYARCCTYGGIRWDV
jgi:hypothetical protein